MGRLEDMLFNEKKLAPEEEKAERVAAYEKKWAEKKRKANINYLAKKDLHINYNPYEKGINADKFVEGIKQYYKGSRKKAATSLKEFLEQDNIPLDMQSEAYRIMAEGHHIGIKNNQDSLGLVYANKAVQKDNTNPHAWATKAQLSYYRASYDYTFWRAYENSRKPNKEEIISYYEQASEAIENAVALQPRNEGFIWLREKIRKEYKKYLRETKR